MNFSSIKETSAQASDTLRILSDPNRFEMLYILFRAKEEMCVKEIADVVGMSHSATSHQLARLEDKGIVASRRVGQTICYWPTNSPITKTLSRIILQFE